MSGERILVVEDNADDEELALWALKGVGLTDVSVARNGREALESLLGDPGGEGARMPDLVLLDLRLPERSGLEVLEALRADPRTRRLPVVVCTSSEDPRDRAACERLGALAVLSKPPRGGEIREFLLRVRNPLGPET